MADELKEDVYASLLLTDTYLPGALVLAHSLHDAGTNKKLAILVTPDTVSVEVIAQLENVYDYVIPVPRIRNQHPENLFLMDRPDLHSAFTKINLWKQTQFRKIVYIDADVVAYRAPDELFHLPHAFSAAPDIGWPDLFNTGVMALTPNMDDYNAMMAMAEKGVSFDGADQGLLNMHFKENFNRLSFTYNVTPSAHYQYVPAYMYNQSNINLIHFIGSGKPWLQGRGQSTGSGPYDQMVGRWWAVYDRHYSKEGSAPELVKHFVKGEFHPTMRYVVPTGDSYAQGRTSPPSWDAQKQPPPTNSRPEALNFPQAHYEMSKDASQFVAPDRYPSPPKGMWYDVPKERERPKPIFPWEANQPRPTRVFGDQEAPSSPIPEQKLTQGTRSRSGSTMTDSSTVGKSEPNTPPQPVIPDVPSVPRDIWSSFPRTNAWDEVPQINRYIDSIQKHRRTRSQGLGLSPPAKQPAQEAGPGAPEKREGSRVTDFPSEDDRPSLPVTPAPIRRPKFWGVGGPEGTGQGESDEQLPVAEGVPPQTEWDPVAQLQKLAKQQSNALLQKLGAADAQGEESISTEVSPKPIKPTGLSPASRILATAPEIVGTSAGWWPGSTTSTTATLIPEPSYHGPGATFEKGEDYPTYETPALPTDEDRDILDT